MSRRVSREELDQILADHAKWLRGEGGERADLRGTDLRGASFYEANLRGTDLRGTDLRGTDLRRADHDNTTRWPAFQICEGQLTVWGKKVGHLVRMTVPADAKRTASLVGRKCRAEYVITEWIEKDEQSVTDKSEFGETVYQVGQPTHPDSYDDNPLVECTHGIHFFLTREEAEEW